MRFTEWFLDNQVVVATIMGGLSMLVVFALDTFWPGILGSFLISMLLIFAGARFFPTDTSVNWLEFSYPELVRKAVGGALMLIGWTLVLRLVVARAIGFLLLWMG